VTDDPRELFVAALKRGLRRRPLRRRRVAREIAAHLDDTVTELRAGGMEERAAVDEALRRIGDVSTIASAFREVQAEPPRASRVRWLRSPAWVAVGAMSVVTAVAAELPQASGAKPTAQALPAVHAHHSARPAHHGHRRSDDRSLVIRAHRSGRL
jgi:hypothetical protein